MMSVEKIKSDFTGVDSIRAFSLNVFAEDHPILARYLWLAGVLIAIAYIVNVKVGQIVALIITLSYFTPYMFAASKARSRFMAGFAKVNGYVYSEVGDASKYEAKLFSIGHARRVSHLVRWTEAEMDIDLFHYEYMTGSGKSRRSHYYTVFAIKFETDFPHIALMSKTTGWRDSFMLGTPPTVSLEEEYAKRYTLMVESGYETEALQIFTKEFLAKLMSYPSDFSFEFKGNYMYIFDDIKISLKTELLDMNNTANDILTTVGPLLVRLRDDFEALHPHFRK